MLRTTQKKNVAVWLWFAVCVALFLSPMIVSADDFSPTPLPPQPEELAYRTLNYTLDIPILNVTSEIVEVPLQDDKWAVLWLGYRSGLLRGSAMPGEGTSLLAGHNHLNREESGPFLFIWNLKYNDRIFIRNPKNELIEFAVYKNELFLPNEFSQVLEAADEYDGSIVLITCENEQLDGSYADRRVVFARPVTVNH